MYRQGASATTLADVAQAADVPLGNVYYYFKTKDDLILVVDRQGVLVVADLLEGSHNAARSPWYRPCASRMLAPCSPRRISTAEMSTPADASSWERAGISDCSGSGPTTW
jgi:AcrR family transcriptional regulator